MICDMMVGNVRAKRVLAGAAVVLSALLSGCVQPKPVTDDVQMSATPEQLRRAPTQPAVRQTEPEEEKPAKKATNVAKQPELPPTMPDATIYRAAELVGKSQTEVAALIGAPEHVEQRAASTVWTYRKDACGLDVFFFLDMATSDERVLTVEPTSDTVPAPAPEAAGDAAAEPAPAQTAVPAATAQPAAEVAASDAESSPVDMCYGKLRRG